MGLICYREIMDRSLSGSFATKTGLHRIQNGIVLASLGCTAKAALSHPSLCALKDLVVLQWIERYNCMLKHSVVNCLMLFEY
tara:strand:- start:350 stop:595 length:246 start_codon:yes stop_codon:yes gene_type:complete